MIIDYAAPIQDWYEALPPPDLQVDFVPPTGDLAGYKLVVAPQLYLLTDAASTNLSGVRRGRRPAAGRGVQ